MSDQEMREAAERLNKAVTEVLQFATLDLTRKDELGEFNFADLEPVTRRIFRLFRDVQQCDFSGLPLQTIREFDQTARAMSDLLKKMASFSLKDQNPNQVRRSISDELQGFWHNAYAMIAPRLAYAASLRGSR